MTRVLAFLAATVVLLAADAAYGQRLDVSPIPGMSARLSLDATNNVVSIENWRLTNPSSSQSTTGSLYVGLRATTGQASTSSGFHLFDVDHHEDGRGRVDLRIALDIDDSTLRPGQHIDIPRISYPLRRPPDGTYYIHITVYQWNPSLPANGANNQIGFHTSGSQWTLGGDDVADDDHGNDRSSATRVDLPSTTEGRIERGDDVDYFRFQVSGTQTVTMYTTGSTDTVGTLYDGSGRELTENDDGGSGLNFRIERSLSAGTYYIRVRSFGTGTGTYTLRLETETAPPPDRDIHGNTRSTATRIELPSATGGRMVDGHIEPGDDVDYFRFEVSGTRRVSIWTSGNTDTVGRLEDRNGRTLASDDDGGTRLNFSIVRTLSGGTYYVRVESYSTRTGPYTLRFEVESVDDPNRVDDHGDTHLTATPVETGSTTGGRIELRDDVDYFRFDISGQAATFVNIDTLGGLDTVGTLQTVQGDDLRNLRSDDDSGTGNNFYIRVALQAGTYYVRVVSYGSGTGAYNLRILADGNCP